MAPAVSLAHVSCLHAEGTGSCRILRNLHGNLIDSGWIVCPALNRSLWPGEGSFRVVKAIKLHSGIESKATTT